MYSDYCPHLDNHYYSQIPFFIYLNLYIYTHIFMMICLSSSKPSKYEKQDMLNLAGELKTNS